MIRLLCLLALPLALAAQAGDLVVRMWQLESGGLLLIKQTPVRVNGDVEIRIRTDGPRGPVTFAPLRIDAALTVVQAHDSVHAFGVAVTGIVSHDPSTGTRDAYRVTVHERRTPMQTSVRLGESIWLFPFGRPAAGESSLAFEILPADSATPPSPGTMPHTYLMDAANLRVESRPAARIAVRLRVEGPAPVSVSDTLVVHRPVVLPVTSPSGRHGISVRVRPPSWHEPEPWVCFTWAWIDAEPPGGGLCIANREHVTSQLIFGSGGLILHIERLP